MWPLLSSTTFSGSAVRKNTSWLIWDFIRLCPFQPCLCHLLLESLMLLLEVGGSDAGRADSKLLVAPLASSSKTRITGTKLSLSSISPCLCFTSLSRESINLVWNLDWITLTWPSFRPSTHFPGRCAHLKAALQI